jgi:hypothetical protein
MIFELKELSERQQADFKADGRMRAYLAMKKAFKKRASESGVTIQSLSEALGRDKGQISRVLSGRSAGVTLDTFVLIMSALGFRSSFDATPVEKMNKRNRNVAPANWQSATPLQMESPQGVKVYIAGASQTNTAGTYVKITDHHAP